MSNPHRNSRWGHTPGTPRSREIVPAGQTRRTHAEDRAGVELSAPAGTVGIISSGGDDQTGVATIITVALRCAAHPGVSADLRGLYSQMAHRLAHTRFAAFEPLALDAARLRAQVLDERGEYAEAGQLWGHLIALYQLTHNAEREQQARIAHALDLHRTGVCGEALNQISYAWEFARQPTRPPSGAATVLQMYAGMLTACGRNHDHDSLQAEAAALPETLDSTESAASDRNGEPAQLGTGPAESHEDGAEGPEVQTPGEHRKVCGYHALAARQGRS